MKFKTPEMRKKVSLFLFLSGALLAILPLSGNRSFSRKPDELLRQVTGPGLSFSVDEVARFIVSEDSSLRLIDLREPGEFMKANIPGSVNVPYREFIAGDPDIYLNDKKTRVILYGNDDYYSNFALVYTRGLGYNNTFAMDGGMNEWYRTITEARFTGSRISARENALFEVRARAARLFNEINALPDSLKAERIKSAGFSAKKLDGGCE